MKKYTLDQGQPHSNLNKKIIETDQYITAICQVCRAAFSFRKGASRHNEGIRHRLSTLGYTCNICATKQAKEHNETEEGTHREA